MKTNENEDKDEYISNCVIYKNNGEEKNTHSGNHHNLNTDMTVRENKNRSSREAPCWLISFSLSLSRRSNSTQREKR